ncbi:MAG: glycoside hydrolase family 16 protein [Acidobacteriaceae bacterium]
MNPQPAIYSIPRENRPISRRFVLFSVGLFAVSFLASAATAPGSSPRGSVDLTKTPSIAHGSEKLVWSDEFNGQSARSAPDPTKWVYDTGYGHWGNRELESYCAYGSSESPCSAGKPNIYVGRDGYLHIVVRRSTESHYTSARIKTEGLASFQYGRMEARIRIPAGQGLWPAFWMLGDSIQSVGWPKCGEFDIMENIGKEPAVIHGSIHGQGFIGTSMGLPYTAPGKLPFSQGFHTFGLIWSPGTVQYYVDSPSNVYATFTPSSLPAGAVWPFDSGNFFFILNLAIGGDRPGAPNAATHFPAEMLVDYVRVWQRTSSGLGEHTEKNGN